ncbi:MAG TPA: HU family DNA-binding protein [Candidatus Udaeobacter sp.]|nr:HU family DNA-binding protein [Candidatus Udaeobacter sp.]
MKVATRKTAKRAAPKATGAASYKFAKADRTRSKGQIVGNIAEKTGLTRKQVVSVFDAMTAMLQQDLKSGPKTFSLAGLAKFTVQYKPATKARKGINPFTGQEAMFKAKPARNVVKIRALKALKDSV